jgi:hypothetical protein
VPIWAANADAAAFSMGDHDMLFLVAAKLVIPVTRFGDIEDGDNRKKTARKNLARIFPGIEPDK